MAKSKPKKNRKKSNVDSSYRRSLLFSFSVLFLFWFVITDNPFGKPIVSEVFLPSPIKVISTFISLATDGYQGVTLFAHLMISLQRLAEGFLVSIIIGVPLGLLMGMNRVLQGLLDPPIEIFRPVPKLIMLPLLIIWFGIGELPKVLIIVMSILPILSVSAMQAVKSVSKKKIDAAYSLGASHRIVFFRIILPASMPSIFTAFRVSIGVGVTMLVGAEMIGTSEGIAWLSMNAADFLQTDVVLVGIIIMALLGYLLDVFARLAEARLIHWSGKQ